MSSFHQALLFEKGSLWYSIERLAGLQTMARMIKAVRTILRPLGSLPLRAPPMYRCTGIVHNEK